MVLGNKAPLTVELDDKGERMARVHAYTAGVYFAETTSAKATLLCLGQGCDTYP